MSQMCHWLESRTSLVRESDVLNASLVRELDVPNASLVRDSDVPNASLVRELDVPNALLVRDSDVMNVSLVRESQLNSHPLLIVYTASSIELCRQRSRSCPETHCCRCGNWNADAILSRTHAGTRAGTHARLQFVIEHGLKNVRAADYHTSTRSVSLQTFAIREIVLVDPARDRSSWRLALIDILNKDCRRSCSAILTWVLENVKISVRPLNSIGNERIFTLLLKF